MKEFTEEERKITRVALKNMRSCYEKFLEEFKVESLREKIDKYLTIMESATRKLNGAGDCIFIYVSGDIRDLGLEEKLRSKVPRHPDYPNKKNVFWSREYHNLVVRGHEKEAEEVIEEYNEDEKTLVKSPEWMSKANIWQIVDKNEVESN